MRGLRAVRLRIDSSRARHSRRRVSLAQRAISSSGRGRSPLLRRGLVLADLAAGIDDAVRNAARIAGAGVDDCEGVAEPAVVGACKVRYEKMSPVKERSAPNGRSPAHFLTLGWSQPQFLSRLRPRFCRTSPSTQSYIKGYIVIVQVIIE
jgi:hypothetical protein